MNPHRRPGDSDKPTAAVIGCGRIAGSQADPTRLDVALCHAAGYRDAGFRLVACCDPDPQALATFAERWAVPGTFASAENLLESVRPDVISICSPTIRHRLHLSAALQARTPVVLMEKPIAATLAEAGELEAEARNSETVVAVNYFRRFNPALVRLRKHLRSGDLGKPQRVNVFYNKGLFHNGSHFVDLIRWFFDEFASVQTLWAQEADGGDLDADLRCLTTSGIPVLFQCPDHRFYNLSEVDILLSKGRVRITNSGRIIELYQPESDEWFSHLRFLGSGRRETDNPWTRVYAHTMAHLADLLRSRETSPVCTLRDGAAAMEVCQAARDSYEQGRTLSLISGPGHWETLGTGTTGVGS